MTYEDFQAEIAEVCTTLVNDLEVQNEISRIVDSYNNNISPIQLLILIPNILIKTKRENSLEFSICVTNGWVELTTKKFTIKVN